LALSAAAYADRPRGDDEDGDGGDGRAHERATPCEQTAQKAQAACLFDTGDTLLTTIAGCTNLGDAAKRTACIEEARATRKDDVEECMAVREARKDTCEILGEFRYDPDPLLAPASAIVDPDSIPSVNRPNPYLGLAAGRTRVFRTGENGEETNVVYVTFETREILGVPCRTVADIVVSSSTEDGAAPYEPIEVTDDWLAQDSAGNVYYCGELTREYEDGVLRDLTGSFEAGFEGAKAGYLVKAAPAAGGAHRQEFLVGEAEDVVQYVSLSAAPTAAEGGDNPAFPCGTAGCLDRCGRQPRLPHRGAQQPDTGISRGQRVLAGAAAGSRTRSRSDKLRLAGTDCRGRKRPLPRGYARAHGAFRRGQHQTRQIRRFDRSACTCACGACKRSRCHGWLHERHDTVRCAWIFAQTSPASIGWIAP